MRFKLFIFFLACVFSVLEGAERRIALLVAPRCKGEISFAYRIQAACTNIRWKADIFNVQESEGLKHHTYDFVISLIPGNYKHPRCKNYLAIFDPVNHYFNEQGFLRKEYRTFDGYLLTYVPGLSGGEKKSFAKRHKYPYMSWYPCVQRREYRLVEPDYLFHTLCGWGNRLKEEKFQECLHLLDREPYMRMYGERRFEQVYPQSYRGSIPFDSESLYASAAEAGITLIFHSSDHNAHGIPSGRIFEAAASSTVIICDNNAFVQNCFGDAILYIDTDQDGPSIYRQIHAHMEWILANKQEALEKAKRAHAICVEKFALEDQLIRLGRFHDRL